MPDKKPEFVVTDRRKFTEEGDLRTEVQSEERPSSPASAQTSSSTSTQAPAEQESFTPPTAAEQAAQQDAYHASGRQIDEALGQHGKVDPKDFEMTFERLVGSLYMTALIQLGAVQEEGKELFKLLNIDSVGNSSEEFSRIIAADLERWKAVARAGNIKIAQ